MATFTWYYSTNASAWSDISTNTMVFSGATNDISTPVTVATWNAGFHIGSDDPGTDQCADPNHANAVQYVSTTSNTQYRLDGGSTTTIAGATTPTQDQSSIRIDFADTVSTQTSDARFYCFDSTTTTTYAPGVDVMAFENESGATQWKQINDASATQGGDNSTYHLDLANQTTAATHTFYICVSASPESVGAKTAFDFGIALTYS